MDQIDKGPDPEGFTKDVESAIDKLFNASRRIEINPLTNKPRELAQEEVDQRELEGPEDIRVSDIKELESHSEAKNSSSEENFWELDSGLELEEEGNGAVDLEQQISQLDQMLLTLEWEVTQTNVESVAGILNAIQENLGPNPDNNCRELLDLMAQVLEGMKRYPEEVPISGPKVLQKGLNTLRALIGDKIQNQEDREKLLKETKGELESAIFKKESDSNPETGQDLGNFAKEIDSGELEIEDVPQEQSMPSEPDSPENDLLVTTINYHIQVLDECIGQISPVEDLFARTPGMDKLYHFQQKIKNRLENQKETLTKALGGDYSLPAPMPNITEEMEDTKLRTDKKEEKIPTVSVSCPWQRLVTAKWAGKSVAFVPEEVAFCGTVSWWAQKKLEKVRQFQLKRLKTWPWSRLQPLMHGELSNQEERQLQRLEFPVVQNPDSFSNYSQSPNKPIVLVLYRGAEGRVLILDTRLENIFFVPESSWKASTEDREPWAGRFKVEDESVSILTIESLLIRNGR